jgi:hypothetical protein
MEPDLIKRSLYSLGALAFLAIFATGSIDSNTSQSSRSSPTPSDTQRPPYNQKRKTVHIGETGQLRLQSNSEAMVLVASDKGALDAFTKAAVSDDKEGVAALILAGRLWPVKGGTKVRVIGYGGFLNATETQVRILEGGYYGGSGWVASEEVAPASAIEAATPEIRKAKPVLSSSPFAGQKASDTAKPGIKFPLSRIIGQPESIVNKVLGNPDKYHKLPPGGGFQGFEDFPGAIQVIYPSRPTWKALTTVFYRSKLVFIQFNFEPKPMSEEELFTALGLWKANFVVIKSLPGQYGGTQYRGTIDKHVIEIAAWRPTDGPGFCGIVTIELVTPQSSKRAT